jgi:PKD repeat protein
MQGSVPHVFEVNASYVTVADLTMGEVANHAIQIHGENDKDNLLVHNVRIYDTWEQMIKGSVSDNGLASDNGIVECSLLEYTAGIGPQYYIGGVDVHRGANWIVRDNEFRHIKSPETDLAEHAIHFWSNASNTLVERNKIVDCDRGIGFGLGSSGHVGGIIRNNMVYVTRDVGIGLENSPGTRVYNNTVYNGNDYMASIEYRFAGTSGVSIINNLTNKPVLSRNGGSGTVQNNVTNAQTSWFVGAASGDLHLASSSISGVVDQGQTLADVSDDFDGDSRPQGSAYDIGADEYVQPSPVADFSATPTSGDAPLMVQFTDLSTNGPTSWAWDLDGDGSVDSTAQNPTRVYVPGTYTVTLTVSNAFGDHTRSRASYITAGTPRVADLHIAKCVLGGSMLTVTLSWTPLFQALTTTVYYSATLITDENWPGAGVASDSVSGGAGGYVAVVPYSGGTAYFALRSYMAGDFWSALSNVAFCPSESVFLPLVLR